jgi:type II secretory pathway pseudopilin PulG
MYCFYNKILFLNGFTLIEILVVILLCRIVCTYLFNGMQEARNASRDVKEGKLEQ